MTLIGPADLRASDLQAIFGTTYVPENISGASYELRVSGDRLVLPGGRFAGPETEPITRPFVLHPADVAAVGSVEAFTMPWNVVGIVSPKFTTVQQGLLVLHGGVVDPGFGQPKDPGDEPERFYVWVANVGREPVAIQPGDMRLLKVTFFRTGEDATRRPIRAPDALKRQFDGPPDEHDREGPSAGLAYFTDARRVDEDLKIFREQFQGLVIGAIIVTGLAIVGMVVTILVALLDVEHTDEPSWEAVGIVALVCAAVVIVALKLAPDRSVRERIVAARGNRARERAVARRLVDAELALASAKREAESARDSARQASALLTEARAELAAARAESGEDD